MVFSALFFLAGIIIVQQLSVLPEPFWLLCLLFLAGCFIALRYWRLMFFTIGVVWAICFAIIRMQDQLAEQFEGQHIHVEGKVIGLPQYDERSVRFDFSVNKTLQVNADETKATEVNIKKIRLSWYYSKQPIKSGQYWRFTVKLKQPHGRFNPNGFDYERWLFMQNIDATGYVRNKPSPQLIRTEAVFQDVDNIRQYISDKLDQLIENTETRALIKALSTGDKHEISNRQWQVFRDTGTVHLLAISGLHIGLVSGLVYLLFLKINIALAIRSPQGIAAVMAMAIAIFYSALAGFSLPTQRALLMLMITMLAIVLQRNITLSNTLAVALMTVLAFDPLAVLSAGFWLSFLAVVLIVYCLSGRLRKTGYWKSAIKIHWVTAIGLSPVLLFYFQQVSIISPLANLLAVPVISMLVVPLCLFGVLMLFISPVVSLTIFGWIEIVIQGLSWVLSEMARFPFATLTLSAPPLYIVVLAVFGVFVLFLPKGIPARWLGLVFVFPILFQSVDKLESGEVYMTVLDVGQGLSAIIRTANHVLVFDTGAKYSKQYDMGAAVIIPFLKSKAIKKVDTLLISHGDNDHIGGAESILEQLKVDKVLTSVSDKLTKYAPDSCYSGQSWVWDQVLFEILSPLKNKRLPGDNNNSCVLKISSMGKGFLLTGDIEENAERLLVKHNAKKLKSNVLIAPHHGSNTSSTWVFLKQVQPEIILIPAGYKNRFSFPHQKVLERYKKMDAVIYNTATEGALNVMLKNNYIVVESVRLEQRKYWNN